MLKNYLKIAWRNLSKSKTYSFLNIFGLAIGIACASLIFLWVEDELTFDNYFPNKENLHIVRTKQTAEGHTYSFTATPGPLSAALKEDVPEIKNTARITWNQPLLFSLGEKSIYENGYYADPAFTDIFSLQFIEGSPKTALQDINSVVISVSMAKRFFEDTHIVGKTLKINNDEEYTVSGVVEDLPSNTTYRFDWLIPFKNYERGESWLQTWNNNGVMTFVQLKPSADLAMVNKKIYEFIEHKTNGESTWSKTFLYPMARWHLYDSFDSSGNELEGNIKFVRLFSIIAWVILIIACINFMNLATARSEKRSKEVGVRKVVGAEKNTLRIQFISESILLAFVAAVVAVGMAWLSLQNFNTLVNKELTLGLTQPLHLIALLLIVLICGLLAGSYPAFYLSSFNPVTVLKGVKLKMGKAAFIRKGLVVLQFTASIVLIICTVIVYQQIQYVKNRDLGYNRQHVVTTSLRGSMKDHLPVLREELKATGVVENIGVSNMSVLNIGSNTSGIDWEGKDSNNDVLISLLQSDENYLSTLGMKLKNGRNFHSSLNADSSSVVINEAFAKLIQTDEDVVGKTLDRGNPTPYTIIGVVENFVYNNMYSAAEPLMILPHDAGSSGVIYIRLRPTSSTEDALTKIGEVIKKNNPGYPFEYYFLDEQFNSQFKTETMIQRLASVFAVLSIVISCLGLFGLAAFTAERRTKEIGVRKVLGASVPSLANLLSKEFVQLVLISCGVAFPLAWLAMGKWLESYSYHTKVHWWVFLLAGIGALLVALVTVSSQAIKAAVANPVDSLRDE